MTMIEREEERWTSPAESFRAENARLAEIERQKEAAHEREHETFGGLRIEQFDYDKKAKTLTADASDLNGAFRIMRRFAGDKYGFIGIHGKKSIETFTLLSEARDVEGEVTKWIFVSTTNPKLEGLRVIVFND